MKWFYLARVALYCLSHISMTDKKGGKCILCNFHFRLFFLKIQDYSKVTGNVHLAFISKEAVLKIEDIIYLTLQSHIMSVFLWPLCF